MAWMDKTPIRSLLAFLCGAILGILLLRKHPEEYSSHDIYIPVLLGLLASWMASVHWRLERIEKGLSEEEPAEQDAAEEEQDAPEENQDAAKEE